jgi:hypothetical protein
MKLLLTKQHSRAVLTGLGKPLTRQALLDMLNRQFVSESDPGSESFGKLIACGGQAFVRSWSTTALRFEKDFLESDASSSRHSRYERKLTLAQHILPEGALKPGLPLYVQDDPLVIGHTMPYIDGLRSFEDSASTWSAAEATQALLTLHRFIQRAHENKVLLGEVNWTNVGFDRTGSFVAFDSLNYDLPGFPCETVCRRTVDPTLLLQDDGILETDPSAWTRERPYSVNSDWFGFRCIVTKVFTGYWPWDGVDNRAISCVELRRQRVRSLRNLSIFSPKIRLATQGLYRVPESLAEPLYDDLFKSFHEGHRGVFPDTLLTDARWTRCSACGYEFASSGCPCAG